jgi:transcriptional regulator with AAA-type ATPase domain
MEAMTETVSLVRGGADADAGAVAQLVVALVCDRPQEQPSRHLLDEIDVVAIGRGRARQATRSTVGGMRKLDLRASDGAMSEHHARLTRVHGQWLIEDQQSKNGVLVNGRPVQRGRLADGDLVELGGTLIVFRDAVAAAPGPADLDAEALPAALPGLRTFSGVLAAELAGVATAATAAVPVLVRGETGTGKEVIARALHQLSRRSGAFVAVNCGALPAALVEAELFGHRRGAFSGAVEDRPGHVRSADGGTLLLDEVGDLPLQAQATLLRVLQEREVVAIGESLPVRVDVRVVAATHVDLAQRVADGRFRRDLLARLTGLVVTLPNLAERREDLGLLVGRLLARAGAPPRQGFTPAAARALFHHDWPDNVRELDMTLGTALALASGKTIDLVHLPATVRAGAKAAEEGAASDEARLSEADAALRATLVASLKEHGGNISAVARAMGKARWQVHRWLRRFEIDSEGYRR